MQTARHQGRSEDFASSGFGDDAPPAFLKTPFQEMDGPSAPANSKQKDPIQKGGQGETETEERDGIRRARTMREITFQEQHIQMGKRSSARSKKHFRDSDDSFQLHAIPGGWDPIGEQKGEERRDQSFIRHVKPRSEGQQVLMDAIAQRALTVALGPAGTGKTYLAIAAAVTALEEGTIDRIVLSRPAIEAGETLGYLPGTMEEKMSPYLRPLYDALSDRMGGKRLRSAMQDGTIEIAPIAYMRGRTLNNAFVVIDEAQNCTYGQIKMLLTRLGWHSTMVITGDPDQSDLLPGVSGLSDIASKLETLADIAVVRLSKQDVVRHPLVACMLAAL